MMPNRLDRALINTLGVDDLYRVREVLESELDWCNRHSNWTREMFDGWRLCLSFINARLATLHLRSKATP